MSRHRTRVRQARLAPAAPRPVTRERVRDGRAEISAAGNHALRRLIGRRPSDSALRKATPALLRAWIDKGNGNAQWDREMGSKMWKRREKSGGGYEYLYEVTGFTTIDTDHEGEWKTKEEWDDLRIRVPEDTDDALDEYPMPRSGPQGWDLMPFFNMVQSRGLYGVCNAISAGYLAGMIAPPEGRVGISERNFRQVELFKYFLDGIVLHFHSGDDSAAVTLAFLQWAKSEGLDATWIDNLDKGKASIARERFKEFFQKVRGTKLSAGSTTAQGRYASLTADVLYEKFDALLEPSFDMRDAFQGLVVIKADTRLESGKIDPAGGHAGHELTIRYDPNGHRLAIYDQTGGLVTQGITDQEHLAEILANYLHHTYIAHPMRPLGMGGPPVNNGSFTLHLIP